MINKIKNNYLALNLYRDSEFLNGIVKAIAFEQDISAKDIEDLSIIHFIIYCKKAGIEDLLTKILANFARVTEQEKVMNKGVIRGSIDWGATFKQRVSNGYNDPTLFVTRPTNKVFDIKANQLFKFILMFIGRKLPEVKTLVPGDSPGWLVNFDSLQETIIKASQHPRLKEVTLHKQLSYDLINSTKKHRNKAYRNLAEIAEIYYKLFVRKDSSTLFSVLKQQLLVPQKTDKIYEYVVLFEVINNLEKIRKITGGTRTVPILRSKNNSIFDYSLSNGTNIKIHYQHVPQSFLNVSSYRDTIRAYGLNTKTRIPDIILEIEKSNIYKAAIIEVKYSNEKAYIGNGVQDVQAYLEDFKPILTTIPKALLAIWTNIITRPSDEKSRDIWLASSRGLPNSLFDFITEVLK